MEREEKESEGRRRSACCRTEPATRNIAFGKDCDYSTWTKWDGPSSHSAYSIRRVQETDHKTVFLRGSGDLGLETVNRLDSRRGNAPPLPFIFLIDINSRQ